MNIRNSTNEEQPVLPDTFDIFGLTDGKKLSLTASEDAPLSQSDIRTILETISESIFAKSSKLPSKGDPAWRPASARSHTENTESLTQAIFLGLTEMAVFGESDLLSGLHIGAFTLRITLHHDTDLDGHIISTVKSCSIRCECKEKQMDYHL